MMLRCEDCGKEREGKVDKHGRPKISRGWKRVALSDREHVWCSACLKNHYRARAIEIPLASPIAPDCDPHESGKLWRACMRDLWAASTAAANWITTELYVRDVRRNGQDKMPKRPRTYLYPEIRAKFPTLPSSQAAALEQSVTRKYDRLRYRLIWTGEISLPNHRYPQPASLPAQAWRPLWYQPGDASDPQPAVAVRLGERRWILRLRRGPEFARATAMFDLLCNSQAVQSELVIRQVASGTNDHRASMTERDSGGQRKQVRTLIKLVGLFPVERRDRLSGTLRVRTDERSLLVALDAKGERVWRHHDDQLRRWQHEHRRRLDRWSDDQKAENRPFRGQSRREASVVKQRRRLKTAVDQASRELVRFASRRRYAVIYYDDSARGYLDQFPWQALRDSIARKAAEADIVFEPASGQVAEKTPPTLAKA